VCVDPESCVVGWQIHRGTVEYEYCHSIMNLLQYITVAKMLSISLFRFTVPANLTHRMVKNDPNSASEFPTISVASTFSQFPTPPVVCNSPCFRFPLRLCLLSISPRGLVSWEWSRWWGHGDSVGSEVFTPERLCATHTQQLVRASVHLFFFRIFAEHANLSMRLVSGGGGR
jgi:hypothetical protein